MMNFRSNVVEIVGTRFSDDNDRFLALVTLDSKRNHIAGANTINRSDSTLNIFWEDIATTDDDDVFNSPAQDQLTIKHVRKVAGAQPAFMKQFSGRIVTLVVARGD